MKPQRIFIFVVAILSAIFFPWYVSVIMAILGLVLFDFVEVLFVGFLLDLMYGIASPFYARFIFLGSFIVLYFLFRHAKKWIRIRVR